MAGQPNPQGLAAGRYGDCEQARQLRKLVTFFNVDVVGKELEWYDRLAKEAKQ